MSLKFPSELLGFLNSPWGKSLIIRGEPGSGKTTLALEIMENIFTPKNSVYLSTRVGDQSIYNQFPWVRDSDAKNRIIDAGKKFLRTINPKPEINKKNEVLISGTEVLRSLTNQSPEKIITYNLDFLGINSPELERSIDSLNLIIKNRPVLVIDSIEGIATKLDVDESKLVFAIQKDFVESSGINVIFVSEAANEGEINKLDYLVDGVINLHKEFSDSRILRIMRMEKMRYTQIESSEYLYTLNGGRFEYIMPLKYNLEFLYSYSKEIKEAITGIEFIDERINSRYVRNISAVNFINVKSDIIYPFITPVVIRSLQENKGVIYMADPDKDPNGIYNMINSSFPLNGYENRIKILDLENDISNKKFIVALGQSDREDRMREYMRIIVEMSDTTEGILFVESSRALEKLEGEKINSEALTKVLGALRGTKDELIFLNQDRDSIETINQLFNIVVNIERYGNTLISYGINPYTPYYGTYIDDNGLVKIKLIS